jgi:protein-tyrosine phosphatase
MKPSSIKSQEHATHSPSGALQLLTHLPFDGLSGAIYGSPMPYGKYDYSQQIYAEIKQLNIQVIVMLVSDQEAQEKSGRDLRAMYLEDGLLVIQLPIPDFDVPSRPALEQAVQETLQLAQQGKNIAVHCSAGIGRTGLFMAALAKESMHISGEDAITWVRGYIPGAVETPVQKRFLTGE